MTMAANHSHPLVAALVLVDHAGLLLLPRLPVLALRRGRRLRLALPLRLLEAVGAEAPRTAAVALRRPRVDQVERVLLCGTHARLAAMYVNSAGQSSTVFGARLQQLHQDVWDVDQYC